MIITWRVVDQSSEDIHCEDSKDWNCEQSEDSWDCIYVRLEVFVSVG